MKHKICLNLPLQFLDEFVEKMKRKEEESMYKIKREEKKKKKHNK